MTTTGDKAANIAAAEHEIRAAAGAGADWIVLPEIFAFHGTYDKLWDMAETEDGPLNEKLRNLCTQLKVVLFAGSVGERPTAGTTNTSAAAKKVYNTSYVFGRDGAMLGKYRKTHLFNLKDAQGKPLYCESDGFLAGDACPSVLTIDGWRVAVTICYDLRFPELYARITADQPVDAFVIPSAFTLGTGMYHWELLLRARAVESLCYVLAANQTGTHAPGKSSYGHSMIIDPWGNKIADTGNRPGFSMGQISLGKIHEHRSQLPALSNRRPELYGR